MPRGMRIALIHGNDGSDVRIGKVCRSLCSFGYEVHFIGWDRRPQASKKIDLGFTRKHVMDWKTSYGKFEFFGFIVFIVHAIFKIQQIRPRVVCAVNEDHAFFILPFKYIFYRYLVCDVFDGLFDRLSNRSLFSGLVCFSVSDMARMCSDRLIATDCDRFERFGRHRHKTVVIENVPEDPGPRLWQKLPRGAIKVWMGGSLAEDRGLRHLMTAVEALGTIEIVAAGWAYDAYATDVFLAHPRVDFRGVLVAADALAAAAECDAVFAFYAPSTVNHRWASPNKVYDAMAIGRPVIVNAEIRMAPWIVAQNLGLSCRYDDIGALREILTSLSARRRSLHEFGRHSRDIYLRNFTWSYMEYRLARLYGSIE